MQLLLDITYAQLKKLAQEEYYGENAANHGEELKSNAWRDTTIIHLKNNHDDNQEEELDEAFEDVVEDSFQDTSQDTFEDVCEDNFRDPFKDDLDVDG